MQSEQHLHVPCLGGIEDAQDAAVVPVVDRRGLGLGLARRPADVDAEHLDAVVGEPVEVIVEHGPWRAAVVSRVVHVPGAVEVDAERGREAALLPERIPDPVRVPAGDWRACRLVCTVDRGAADRRGRDGRGPEQRRPDDGTAVHSDDRTCVNTAYRVIRTMGASGRIAHPK
jgi:hypothetical protein